MRIWGQAEPAEVNSGTVNPIDKGIFSNEFSKQWIVQKVQSDNVKLAVEEVEATIVIGESPASKKQINSDENYQPGNLFKTIDIPQVSKTQPEPSAEDLEKFKFDVSLEYLELGAAVAWNQKLFFQAWWLDSD